MTQNESMENVNSDNAITSSTSRKSTGSLLVIFLTVFIDLLGFGIVLPLLPLYADQFSVDQGGWVIGLLMAIFSIMQFLFAPLWGSLSDRFGRRPIILIGLAGSFLFYGLFGLATIYESLIGIFLTRIGAGIAGATIPTAQAYIADTTTKETRTRGMALIGMAFGLGFTLGPVLAYFAISSEPQGHPGPGPGFVASALSGVAFLLAIFLLPESHTPGKQTDVHRKWIDWGAWKESFQLPGIGWLLLGFFLCLFSFSNLETTLSMLLKGAPEISATELSNTAPETTDTLANSPFQLTYKQVCLVFAAIGFLVALVQGGIVRPLAKRVEEKWLAIGGSLLEIAGFLVLTFTLQQNSYPLMILSLILIVTGYGCLQPSIFSLLSRWTDPEKQGRVLGVGQSVSALARILGSGLGIPMLKFALFLPYAMGSAMMALVAFAIFRASKTGTDYLATNDTNSDSPKDV